MEETKSGNKIYQALEHHFGQFDLLTPSELKLLFSMTHLRRVKKDEHIVREGDQFNFLIIVVKGLLRNYFITEDLKEVTGYFTASGDHTASYKSLLLDQPSNQRIQAIEDSVVLLLDSAKMEKIAIKHPRLYQLQNRSLKQRLAQTIERVHISITHSPEERYLLFKKEHPRMIERVPQKYLASYLGMTEVSLSRIKSRVLRKIEEI